MLYNLENEEALIREYTEKDKMSRALYIKILNMYVLACDCFYHPKEKRTNSRILKDIIEEHMDVMEELEKCNRYLVIGRKSIDLEAYSSSLHTLVCLNCDLLTGENDGKVYNEDASKFSEIWDIVMAAKEILESCLEVVACFDMRKECTSKEQLEDAIKDYIVKKEQKKQICCECLCEIGKIEAKLFEINAKSLTTRFAHKFIEMVHTHVVGEITRGI